jgi:hypothetical protein
MRKGEECLGYPNLSSTLTAKALMIDHTNTNTNRNMIINITIHDTTEVTAPEIGIVMMLIDTPVGRSVDFPLFPLHYHHCNSQPSPDTKLKKHPILIQTMKKCP